MADKPNGQAAESRSTEDNSPPPADIPPRQAQAAHDSGGVDLQTEIQKALAAREAEFARQLKEITGHESLQAFKESQLKEQGKLQELLQSKETEAQTFRQRFEQMAVRAQVLAAASDAVDPEVVLALLSASAQVDDKGNVSIGGKPVDQAVKQLLQDKPYLAKPSGNQGSGSPQNPAVSPKQISRQQFEALDPKAQMTFIRDGGVVTD